MLDQSLSAGGWPEIESQNTGKDGEISHKADVSRSDLNWFLGGLPTKESEEDFCSTFSCCVGEDDQFCTGENRTQDN